MLTEFDPVKFSIEENKFLLKHLGSSSVVALKDIRPSFLAAPNHKDKNPVCYPEGVIPAAVKPVLDGVLELEELEKHDNQKWVGIQAIKDAITRYVEEAEKWQANKGRRGAMRFPSMYTFDSRGRGHLGGVGADSGQVRTFFDSTGTRIPFAISLLPSGDEAWRPEWLTQNPAIPTVKKTLVDSKEFSRIDCFCGHTESYKDGSRASYSAARARMSKHLRRATDSVDDHRELHTQEFS